eukprot:5799511-Heterocapsa_arctica.AAC.1
MFCGRVTRKRTTGCRVERNAMSSWQGGAHKYGCCADLVAPPPTPSSSEDDTVATMIVVIGRGRPLPRRGRLAE